MKKSHSRATAICCAAALLLTMLVPAQTFAADITTDRLAGGNRYETAVSISQAGWPAAENVVLAGGADANLVDALTAAPLAKILNAPILLTESNRLTPVTADELRRLGVKNVYLAGGSGVLTPAVQNAVSALGATPVSLGGSDRFATAANIADEVAKRTTVSTAVVTSAYNNADALSIASIAAARGWPVLLTGPEALPASAQNFIAAHNISATYAIGGSGVISDALLAALPGALRLGGATRYDTNLSVLKQFADSWDYSKGLFVANGAGNHLVDALAASAYIAGAPLLLTDNSALSAEARAFLAGKSHQRVIGLGGTAVTSAIILQNVVSAAGAAALPPSGGGGGGGGGGRGTPAYSENGGALAINQAGAYLIGRTAGANDSARSDAAALFGQSPSALKLDVYNNLTISKGVGAGDVGLAGVTVSGETTISGGGAHSVKFQRVEFQNTVYVNPANDLATRVYFDESSAPKVVLQSASTLAGASSAVINQLEVATTENIVLDAPVAETVAVNGAHITLAEHAQTGNITVLPPASAPANTPPSVNITLADELVRLLLAAYPELNAEDLQEKLFGGDNPLISVTTEDGAPVEIDLTVGTESGEDQLNLDADKTLLEAGTYVIPLSAQTGQADKTAWVQAAADTLVAHGTTAVVTFSGGAYTATLSNGAATGTASLAVTEEQEQDLVVQTVQGVADSFDILDTGQFLRILVNGSRYVTAAELRAFGYDVLFTANHDVFTGPGSESASGELDQAALQSLLESGEELVYTIRISKNAAIIAESAPVTMSIGGGSSGPFPISDYRLDLIEDGCPVLVQGLQSHTLIIGETAGLCVISDRGRGSSGYVYDITNRVTLSTSDPWVVDVNDDYTNQISVNVNDDYINPVRYYGKWIRAVGVGNATVTIKSGDFTEYFDITVLDPADDTGRVAAHAAFASPDLKVAVNGGYDYMAVRFTDQYGDPFAQWNQIFFDKNGSDVNGLGTAFTVVKTVNGPAPVATAHVVAADATGELLLRVQSHNLRTATEYLRFYGYKWDGASTYRDLGGINIDVGASGEVSPAQCKFAVTGAPAYSSRYPTLHYPTTPNSAQLKLMKYTSSGYALGAFTDAEYAGWSADSDAMTAGAGGAFSLTASDDRITPVSSLSDDSISLEFSDAYTDTTQLQAKIKKPGSVTVTTKYLTIADLLDLYADKALIESGAYAIPASAQSSQAAKTAWVQARVNGRVANGTTASVACVNGVYTVALNKGSAAGAALIAVTGAVPAVPLVVNTVQGIEEYFDVRAEGQYFGIMINNNQRVTAAELDASG
ncbi:MAG: cell wall-binding repeat-containing protein, partial [Gracilibacteraceae bacterium]|nr:cell wall-binding repeat-containing protein [Gracilibacteraceae bacterium]